MNDIITKRCYIKKLQKSDFKDAINIFTNEHTRKFLGRTIKKK